MKTKSIILALPVLTWLLMGCHSMTEIEVQLAIDENTPLSRAAVITFTDSVTYDNAGRDMMIGETPNGIMAAVLCPHETDTLRKVLIDSDADGQLEDESVVELQLDRSSDKVYVSIPIESNERSLPFYITWRQSNEEDLYFWASHYCYRGIIVTKEKEIPVRLNDLNSDGFFSSRDSDWGTNLILTHDDTIKYPYGRFCRTGGLIPVNDTYYEIDSMSITGSYLHLKQSKIAYLKIEEKTPEFSFAGFKGEAYNYDRYKDAWLLLDFWFTGCIPCLSKFPELVATFNKYKPELKILGVCVERASKRKAAWDIIEEYNLDWDHAFVEKDHPDWKAFGSMEDNNHFFPFYVLIDPEGVIRYAGSARNQSMDELIKSQGFSSQ